MIKPNTIKNHYIQLYHIMLKILSLFIKLLGSLFYEGVTWNLSISENQNFNFALRTYPASKASRASFKHKEPNSFEPSQFFN